MARPKGKIFDTWRYRDSTQGVDIPVPVRHVKNEGTYAGTMDYGATSSVAFRVVLPEFQIDEEDTDVEKLRSRVFDLIRRQVATKWEPMLYVRWGSATTNGKDGGLERFLEDPNEGVVYTNAEEPLRNEHDVMALVKLEVLPFEAGTKADGSRCHRGLRGYGNTAFSGLPQTGTKNELDWHRDIDHTTGAVLPDTPENRDALARIVRAMHALRDRVAALVHPDRIELTLESVLADPRVLGLPAPGPNGEFIAGGGGGRKREGG